MLGLETISDKQEKVINFSYAGRDSTPEKAFTIEPFYWVNLARASKVLRKGFDTGEGSRIAKSCGREHTVIKRLFI